MAEGWAGSLTAGDPAGRPKALLGLANGRVRGSEAVELVGGPGGVWASGNVATKDGLNAVAGAGAGAGAGGRDEPSRGICCRWMP